MIASTMRLGFPFRPFRLTTTDETARNVVPILNRRNGTVARKGSAKKAAAKKAARTQTSNSGVDENSLSIGELRKLNALRKSVGDKLAEDTFAKWLKRQKSPKTDVEEDKNAALIADALMTLIEQKNIRIPRGGYQVTRGRGRVIVEQPKAA
jgi:hypothetical protein